MGEIHEVRTVAVDDVDAVVDEAVSIESDSLAVGRPRWIAIVDAVIGQAW
jgi:hypothetical protein